MEIKDDIIMKKLIYADDLKIGECFKYNNHFYLKAEAASTRTFFTYSDIAYVDLTDNKIHPSYEFKGVQVEPVKAHVQIKYCK